MYGMYSKLYDFNNSKIYIELYFYKFHVVKMIFKTRTTMSINSAVLIT